MKPVSPQCSALPHWSLFKQERLAGFCPSPGVSHPFVSLEVNKERGDPSLLAPPQTSSVPEHGLKPLLRCILTSLPDFYLWIALRLLTDLTWMDPGSVLPVLPEVWSPQNINRKGRCQRKTVRGWAHTSSGLSRFQPEENYILGRTQPHSLYQYWNSYRGQTGFMAMFLSQLWGLISCPWGGHLQSVLNRILGVFSWFDSNTESRAGLRIQFKHTQSSSGLHTHIHVHEHTPYMYPHTHKNT